MKAMLFTPSKRPSRDRRAIFKVSYGNMSVLNQPKEGFSSAYARQTSKTAVIDNRVRLFVLEKAFCKLAEAGYISK